VDVGEVLDNHLYYSSVSTTGRTNGHESLSASHRPTSMDTIVASILGTSRSVITGRNEYISHSFGCMDLVQSAKWTVLVLSSLP